MRSRMMLLLALLLMFTIAASAQSDPWADAVVSVEYGPGAGFGQDYFPDNVLGSPSPDATPTAPAADPSEVLTLGSGGVIVLAFEDGGIEDGPGVDVIVYENAFAVGGGETIYRETALVAFSEDGTTWVTVPYDTTTFAGLAGVTPTNSASWSSDPLASGGDGFDLADVGLEHASYIRLTDSEGLVRDSGPSFDLDAVAVLHGEAGTTAVDDPAVSIPTSLALRAWPNPFNASVTVQIDGTSGAARITVVDLLGRVAEQAEVSGHLWTWQPRGLASGTYLVRVQDSEQRTSTTRVVLVR